MTDNLPERQPEGRRYPTHADIGLIARFGKMFAISGLFDDIKGEVQAAVKVLAGREVGLQPFESMNAIDIISGKPVFNSGFLAARVKSHERYSYRVVEISDDRCEIVFLENGENIGTSIFTTEDAQKAGLLGGRSGMYQKYPRNMLFARALSNGVAWHCPDVLSGRGYVEGEIPEPSERPEQEGGPSATVPDADPDEHEEIVDVEPEQNLAVQEPMTGTASATLEPEGVDQKTAAAIQTAANTGTTFTITESTPGVDTTETLTTSTDEAEVSQREATAAQMLAARKAEGKTQSEPPATDEPAFGAPLTDEEKIAVIGRLFRPADPNALPAPLRTKVKAACTYLDCWGKNTPTELFLLLGDEALTHQGLQEGLARLVEAETARRKAPKPQEPTEAPQREALSPAEMLRRQEENIAKVQVVLEGLSSEQSALVAANVEAPMESIGEVAKDLWIRFGAAALDPVKLLSVVDSPPWEAGEHAGPLGPEDDQS